MLRINLLLLGVVALMSSGCQKTLPAVVEGVIRIDGQSLPEDASTKGEVMFYPTGGGAAAYGSISTGGKYLVKTGDTEGLEPGEYKVTVRVVEVPPEPPGGFQNAPPQKMISPPRYQSRDQSDLIKEVQPGKNVIDLDLASK